VIPHPERSKTVMRIFELYSTANYTLDSLSQKLLEEGFNFQPTQRKFPRTTIAYILNNRFYIGEIRRNGNVFEGKYRRYIDRQIFDRCQDILQGKTRRLGVANLAYSGELLTCAHCGQSITGEKIKRKLKDGSYNEHIYYRCANNKPPSVPI
jgi:hypothetical protein